MVVENTLGSAFTLRRSGYSVRISPGLNNMPDYEWLKSSIDVQPHLRYVPDYTVTKKGVIKRKRKKGGSKNG